MRTRPLVLSALFLVAVLATARSQPPAAPAPAPVPAKDDATVVQAPATTTTTTTTTAPSDTPAAPAATTTTTVVEKPAEVPAGTAVIKEEPAHGTITTKSNVASGKDTLSVDFPDEDIRNVLRNVADLFELNLVMPDTLQGKTSIKLRDVTWRQIFEVVLKQVGVDGLSAPVIFLHQGTAKRLDERPARMLRLGDTKSRAIACGEDQVVLAVPRRSGRRPSRAVCAPGHVGKVEDRPLVPPLDEIRRGPRFESRLLFVRRRKGGIDPVAVLEDVNLRVRVLSGEQRVGHSLF